MCQRDTACESTQGVWGPSGWGGEEDVKRREGVITRTEREPVPPDYRSSGRPCQEVWTFMMGETTMPQDWEVIQVNKRTKFN